MIEAVYKMGDEGVAGDKFYAGVDGDGGHKYGLANVANFIAQAMHETIQYDACDENNWSDPPAKELWEQLGYPSEDFGDIYPMSAACGQFGQSYQDYECHDIEIDGVVITGEELACNVDTEMYYFRSLPCTLR